MKLWRILWLFELLIGDRIPPGSLVRYFPKRMKRGAPFSPGLRKTIHLLNCLKVVVEDVADKCGWGKLSVDVMRSPIEFKSLSSHYCRLLDKLVIVTQAVRGLAPRDAEMMRLLEIAEARGKLGVWMAIV